MDIFRPIKKWNERQKVRSELSRKSDRQLHDMGMSRDQIPTIARKAVQIF